MAPEFSLVVEEVHTPTSDARHRHCRFPSRCDLQREILGPESFIQPARLPHRCQHLPEADLRRSVVRHNGRASMARFRATHHKISTARRVAPFGDRAFGLQHSDASETGILIPRPSARWGGLGGG